MFFNDSLIEEEKAINNLCSENNSMETINFSIHENNIDNDFQNSRKINYDMALNPNMTLTDKFSDLFPVINSFPLFLIDEQFKENKSIGEKSDSTYFLNNVNEKQNLLFKIKEYKKRGRNSKCLNSVAHNNKTFDNCHRKIQVHFLRFFINISNDVLKAKKRNEDEDINFRNFSYEETQIIKFDSFNIFKNSKIKDIINKMKISPKFTKSEDNVNKEILKKIYQSSHSSQWLNNFFNMNVLTLFRYYYNETKPLNIFKFEGEEINLSKNTKSFYYLLKKYDIIKIELIDALKRAYFNENYENKNKKGKSLFSSTKVEQ